MIDPGLRGKVVLVTGANNPHGIGAAIARAFAAQGAAVFVHYLRVHHGEARRGAPHAPGETFYYAQSRKGPDAVLEALRDLGGATAAWEADLSNPALLSLLFDRAEATLGPVSILVNNAAGWQADTFVPGEVELANKAVELWTDRPGGISPESIERNFAVNARGAALMMAEFARRHVARSAGWGRIINISTDGAYCFPSETSYGASKLALEGYSRSAARELGRFGITVNIISPGATQTGWITPELEAAILPGTPLGRLGQPEDIADVAVFLASEQARWLTGQTLYAGGGARM